MNHGQNFIKLHGGKNINNSWFYLNMATRIELPNMLFYPKLRLCYLLTKLKNNYFYEELDNRMSGLVRYFSSSGYF